MRPHPSDPRRAAWFATAIVLASVVGQPARAAETTITTSHLSCDMAFDCDFGGGDDRVKLSPLIKGNLVVDAWPAQERDDFLSTCTGGACEVTMRGTQDASGKVDPAWVEYSTSDRPKRRVSLRPER